MGKNKLAKFGEMAEFPHVFQFPFGKLVNEGFPMAGLWNETFFKNDKPIILELGCGRGEYTVGLGRLFPESNFIGVDIKGARMWTGAKESFEAGMKNIAFLRTDISLIERFFGANEVSEIWLTFPDPQMKNVNKRLTSTRFIKHYQHFLKPDGIIHLKTDSNFMFKYTEAMAEKNKFPILSKTENLYQTEASDAAHSIQTYYEQQWIGRGINIRLLEFVCETRNELIEPDIEIEFDSYRSYNRSKRSALDAGK